VITISCKGQTSPRGVRRDARRGRRKRRQRGNRRNRRRGSLRHSRRCYNSHYGSDRRRRLTLPTVLDRAQLGACSVGACVGQTHPRHWTEMLSLRLCCRDVWRMARFEEGEASAAFGVGIGRYLGLSGVGSLWDCVLRVCGGGGGFSGGGVPRLCTVPALSWCGEVSLGGNHIISHQQRPEGRGGRGRRRYCEPSMTLRHLQPTAYSISRSAGYYFSRPHWLQLQLYSCQL